MNGVRRLTESDVRREIVGVCRRMYEKGLIASADGNVSARLDERRILTTPSGAHKGVMSEADVVVVDDGGRPQRGGRPSSELQMHLMVYRERPDVRAIVHAHPPTAIACTIAGIDLEALIVPEVVFALGKVVTVPYATPTTLDVPHALEGAVRDHDALMLERHGSLTLGPDLATAYNRLEALEHTAKIVHLAHQVGPVVPLAPDEVERLYEVAERAGIRWRFRRGLVPAEGDGATARLIEAVVVRVLEGLRTGGS